MSAETAETLRLVRHFPAPPAVVFRAWTDPGQLQRWWGPPGFSVPSAEIDLRPGGQYRLHMRAPDRPPFSVGGIYVEVTAPTRLVYTWQWTGTENDDFESLITVEFRARPPGTEVTLIHERLPGRYMAEHQAGWGATLDRLGELLAAKP